MSPWAPLVLLGLFAGAWVALDLMYWVGYLDGKRAREREGGLTD